MKIIREDPHKTGLFLGTGSGKSLIALSLARGKTLVIAPKTQVLDGNWEREVAKNKLKVKLTVMSKETFRRDAHRLQEYDTVIVDEAETCLGVTPNIRWRNKQAVPKASQLFEALTDYLTKAKPKRIYLCTATIVRSPMTVWGAAKILGRDWDFYKYRDKFYFRLPMPGREIFMAKKDDETKKALAKLVQSLGYVGKLSDYFDVPDQVYKTVYVETNDKQDKALDLLPLDYPDPLVLCGKKHQVENGVLVGNEFLNAKVFDNAKLDKILDYAIEFPRLVIFAKYSSQIHMIHDALKKAGKYVIVLDGSTKDRKEALRLANLSEDCAFICQSQISAGWELPDYPVMVFASMSYSITDRIQAEGRILRANKLKKNLFITLVVRGGVDEAVFKSIENKQDFVEKLYVEQHEKRS